MSERKNTLNAINSRLDNVDEKMKPEYLTVDTIQK